MSSLQVRGVPDDVRATLKDRASSSGRSLSEYVLDELSRLARQPTIEELTERIHHRGSVEPRTRAANVLRTERGRRQR